MLHRHKGLSASIAAAMVSMLACGPGTGTSNGGVSGTAGTGASGSKGGGPGSGAGGDTGASLGNFEVDSGTSGDGALSPDSACGQTLLKPESVTQDVPVDINCKADSPAPIAIYLVLDNSGSMKDNNKWPDAVAAISSFVQTTGATGTPWTCVDKDGNSVPAPADLPPPGTGSISVAIQYFHPQNVPSPNECDGSAHAIPAVPMATIPGNAAAITGSLAATGPSGDTPTVGALMGGESYCAGYQANNPGVKCVVVLLTDGQPNGCGLSSSCGLFQGNDCVDPNAAATLTPIVANAYGNATNSVTTFTVGMNGVTADGFTLLNALAIAGGSDCTPGVAGNEACNVTTGGSQGFLDALNSIRATVQVTKTSSQSITTNISTTLPCEWSVPDPPPGKTFDKDLVNVKVTAGGAAIQPGNVPTLADCAASGDGWYYDDPVTPHHILACPNTCDTIKNDPNPTVQVLFGCATKPAIFN